MTHGQTTRFRAVPRALARYTQAAGPKIYENVNYTQRETMEGPPARHGVPREWGLGRGTVAPPQYGGLGALPQEILKFNSANLFIFSTISRHFATSHNTLQQSQLHT